MPRSFTAPREASAAAASAGAGAMRGGGGRQPFAAPEGSDAAAIPAASRKTQDTFHEVTRKRDKKMEPKAPSETRPRTLQKSTYEGYKTGSDRTHSVGVFRGAAKKEPEFHAPLNSSALDVKTTETISATRNIGQADAENTTSQPPSQAQHGWGGIPGRPSMAEIVKMGRPQAKVGRGPVASSTAMPAIGDSVISKKSNHTSKQTVFASEFGHGATDKLPHGAIEVSVPKDATSVDMLPLVEGTDVEASSMSAEAQGSSTLDIRDGGIEKDTNLEECTTENLTVSGQFSASGEDIQSEYTEVTTHQDDGSIEKTDDFHSNDLPFEDNQNLNGDLCTTAKQIDHLTLHEGPKLFDDNPAVIIPDHLGVSNADCAHLMFGTFLFGTLDASLTTKPLDGHGDVATVLDDHSIDTPDVRIYEDESKEEVTLADNMENLDVTMAQQSEVTRANFLDVTNNTEFNLSSTSDYGTSSAALQDSASHNYLQVEFSYSDLELENFLCRWVNEGNTDLPVLDIYAQKAEELGHNRVFLVNLREAKNSSKAKPKYNRTSDGGRWKKSHPLKNVGCTRAKKDKYNYCRDGESESSNISLYEYTLVDGPKDQVLCHILYNAQSAPEIRKKPKKGSKNDPHVPEDDKDIEEETQRAIEELRKEAECLRVELKQARDDRDHSVSQLNSLNIELADYKERIGKSSKQHERLRRKVSELEATLNRQREQIQTLQKQLAVTTEKLKLAEVEAMTLYEEQNEKRKNLEVRLAQAESQIVEGDKYRKELQNTILELEADMCVRERGLGFSRLREGSRQRSGKPPFVPREHRCN